LLQQKYVIFKDDDVGKDLSNLKKWIDLVLKNNAKAAIGLIGKHLKNNELREYLKSLDKDRIEIFCHGYSHSYLPFLEKKFFGKNRIFHAEFDKDLRSHDSSLKRYRELESQYLGKKAITFGPPGNIWNKSAIDALAQNDFKLMFAWEKIEHKIFTIPLTSNLKQNSLDEFISGYENNKNDLIYTLQFHHADLAEKQFKLTEAVIDFLKNNENRIFIKPSELLEISKKDKNILKRISPKN